jgi:hypothetical protein
MPTRTSISSNTLTFTTVASGSNDFVETRITGKSHNRAIFGFGYPGSIPSSNITNLVNVFGDVALDVTTSGTGRYNLAAAGYGFDKAMFGFGWEELYDGDGNFYAFQMYNVISRISNLGVYVSETSGIGTARGGLAAAGYGLDKAIFGFGNSGTQLSYTNLVSNIGILSGDTTNASANTKEALAATTYGLDKAIFGFGYNSVGAGTSTTNLVSNVGVLAATISGVSGVSTRTNPAAAGYGGDKAIFGYGSGGGTTSNKVSNLGVVISDTAGVGTFRFALSAADYGGDKAIFGYGSTGAGTAGQTITNKVSNLGIVGTDNAGVGTKRHFNAAASWG